MHESTEHENIWQTFIDLSKVHAVWILVWEEIGYEKYQLHETGMS
jgi:hypothetical protein